MPKRQVTSKTTKVAGEGGDGNLYGVTTITTTGKGRGGCRYKVCPTCPWRLDAEIGRFPPEAYRHSASTAYDGAMNTFSCHESGADTPQTCAGFLRANADNNIGVRLAMSRGDYDPSKLVDDVPLYESYREMAVANGVEASDPALALIRSNHDSALTHMRTMRKAHKR